MISENNQLSMIELASVNARDGDSVVDELLFDEASINGPKIRYGYKTGGMRFLVPEGAVSELLHGAKIFHLPNAPKWVCGLINMHGNVIPVIDLASLTGDEISHLSKSNILAIRKNDIAVAVLIDGLPEAVTGTEIVKISDIGDVPAELNNYMNEGISSKSVVWIELNIYGLLKELALLHAETDNK